MEPTSYHHFDSASNFDGPVKLDISTAFINVQKMIISHRMTSRNPGGRISGNLNVEFNKIYTNFFKRPSFNWALFSNYFQLLQINYNAIIYKKFMKIWNKVDSCDRH